MARRYATAKVQWNQAAFHELVDRNSVFVHKLIALGEEVAERARETCLVGATGDLQKSIHVETRPSPTGWRVLVVADVQDPKTGVPYAIFHENKRKVVDKVPHRSLIPALYEVVKRHPILF